MDTPTPTLPQIKMVLSRHSKVCLTYADGATEFEYPHTQAGYVYTPDTSYNDLLTLMAQAGENSRAEALRVAQTIIAERSPSHGEIVSTEVYIVNESHVHVFCADIAPTSIQSLYPQVEPDAVLPDADMLTVLVDSDG